MNETDIQNQLKQNLPTAPEPTAPVATPAVFDDSAAPYGLDEMTEYKLHRYFGEDYQPNSELAAVVTTVYRQVAELYGAQDYLEVVTRVRDIERMMGISHEPKRAYKVHRWLGLESIRRRTEQEMTTLWAT